MGGIRGAGAVVKWNYHTAASLTAYTVSRDDVGVWQLYATVVEADPYLLTQRPLIFVAPHKRGAFRWPIETWDMADDRLTAQLGPPL
jgi:hypothetical protein